MSQLTFPFDLEWMFVDVLVNCGGDRLADLLAKGKPVPPSIWTRGMIDTGTNVSAVSRATLDQLEIPAGRAIKSEGIDGEFTAHLYDVRFTIADKLAKGGPTYSPWMCLSSTCSRRVSMC